MITLHSDGIMDAVDLVRAKPKNRANAAMMTKAVTSRQADDSWYGPGVANCEQALEQIERSGNPVVAGHIQEMRESLVVSLPRALGIRRRKHKSDHGDEFDIHASIQGRHDRAWTRSTRELRHGLGVVRIVADIGGNCDVDAQVLQWRGIAAVVLSDILREAGYSVEIIAGFSANHSFRNNPVGILWTCVVKSRFGSTDVETLSATVASPAFFRTCGFAAIIHAADRNRLMITDGLGSVVNLSTVLPSSPDFIELFVSSSVANIDTCREWINDSIAVIQGDNHD